MVADLVRAIRRAMRGRTHKHSDQIDSWPTDTLVSFRVEDIHEFARRLVEEGVNVREEAA